MATQRLDRGQAMEALVYSLIFGCSAYDVPPEDSVGGNQEKQIDFLVVEDNPDLSRATVHVVQVKSSTSFSANEVVKLHNGLRWIWEYHKSKVNDLGNTKLKMKILEIRQLLVSYGPANLDVRVYFVTMGDSSHLPEEFGHEVNNIMDRFEGCGFRSFSFYTWGASDLVDLVNLREQAGRVIKANIPIVYDVNKPSLMKYYAHGLEGGIFIIKGAALARLVLEAPNRSIFDENIRPYLGQNQVNKEILGTATRESDAKYFWFLNNGITMVCDSFDVVQEPDNAHIKVDNLQIVNGCQTSSTLAEAHKMGTLHPDTNVLIKVYATKDSDFVERITFSTNSQTSIGARDLKANNQVQRDLQDLFIEKYGIHYERKVNEFSNLSAEAKRSVVSNEKIGQAYLAVGLRKPTVARAQKYKIFRDEFYGDIFEKASPSALFFSWSVYAYVSEQSKRFGQDFPDDETFAAMTYGGFHLARIMGALLMGSDQKWKRDRVEEVGFALQARPDEFQEPFLAALALVIDILRNRPDDADLINYFKAGDIQKKINARLFDYLGSTSGSSD